MAASGFQAAPPAASSPPGGPVALWRSELLSRVPGVRHGFTTRAGGSSSGPNASLNLSTRTGDERAAVELNRRRVLAALGAPEAVFVSVRQVHGDDLVEVSHMAGRSIEADGLLSRDPRAALAVLVADCVPILMADVRGRAVAAVHAGWRGTEARIAERAVRRLGDLGVPAADLRVALGPAIGPCCFTIGLDVAQKLGAAYPAAGQAIRPEGSGARADLWDLNRQALEESGVAAEHVDALRTCTACTPELFSHRRDHGATGRQAGVIVLRPGAADPVS